MPKEYRFAGTEVKVKHTGNAVLFMPSDQPWGILPTALSLFEPGFTLERSQPDAFKQMPTIGKGVEKLRISDDSGTYRVI